MHKSSKKNRVEETESAQASSAESLRGEANVDTTGMSARQAKKALKLAAAATDSSSTKAESDTIGTDNSKSKTKQKNDERIKTIDTKVIEKYENATIPDTSGLSAREAKRIKKAAKRAAQEESGINTGTSPDVPDTSRSTLNSDKSAKKIGVTTSTSQTIEGRQVAHANKTSKNLPARQEKARRDAQRAIQKFVAELREKGITDSKEIKKEKIKFKKKLLSSQQARMHKRR